MKLTAIWALALSFCLIVSGSAKERPKLLIHDGHSDEVLKIKVLENGLQAATASKDGSIKLWDLVEAKVVRNITDRGQSKEHADVGSFSAAAFTPNGKEAFVVTRGGSHIVRFDLKSGKVVSKMAIQVARDEQLETDGEHIYAITSNGVEKFSLEGKSIAIHQGLDFPEYLSNAAGLLAVSHRGGTVILDTAGFQPKHKFKEFSSSPISLSSDGTQLAGSGETPPTKNDNLRALSVPSGQLVQNIDLEESWKFRPFYLSDNRLFWGPKSSVDEPYCRPLETLADKIVPLGTLRFGSVGAIVPLDQGEFLVSDHSGAFFRLSPEGQVSQVFAQQGSALSTMKSFPQFNLLLTGSPSGEVKSWDLVSGRMHRQYEGLRAFVADLDMSPDGKLIVASDFVYGEITVWDRLSGQKLSEFQVPGGRFGTGAKPVIFVDDKHYLVFGTSIDKVSLVEAGTGEEMDFWDFKRRLVGTPSLHRSGRRVAAVSRDGSVIEWGLDSKRDQLILEGKYRHLCYSEDGQYLILSDTNNVIYRWNYLDPDSKPTELSRIAQELVGLRAYKGRIAAFTFEGNCLQFDQQGKLLRKTDLEIGQIHTAPKLSGDLLISYGAGQSAVFFDADNGDYRGELLEFDGARGWVAIDKFGNFDGNEEGFKKLAFEHEGSIYEIGQFFRDFYRPGVLASIAPGQSEEAETRSAPTQSITASALKKPPEVSILSPQSGTVIEGDSFEVKLQVEDKGIGHSKVALYHNGHRLPGERLEKLDEKTYLCKVKAVRGKNEIYATAFDKSGSVESKRDRIRVLAPNLEARKPRLHLLAVGVDEYKSGLSLKFAEADAKSVGELFRSPLYEHGERKILNNKEATLAAILESIKAISAASEPQDAFIVYLAGHGTVIGDSYFFLPHDADILSDESLVASALSAEQLAKNLSEVPATKQLLVLDSCRSGAAAGVVGRYFAARSGLEEVRSQQLLARASGTFLIAATKAEDYAYEITELGHGVLTYALLESLGLTKNATAGVDVVTANSLLRSVSEKVPQLSEKYHGARQHVVQYSSGEDFPLTK